MRIEKKNKYDIIIESQQKELLECYRKIDEKNILIFSLFEQRDDLKNKIKELLEENQELREKKCKKIGRS